MIKKICNYLLLLLLSVAVVMAFCMNYGYVPNPDDYQNTASEVLLNLHLSLSENIAEESLFAIIVAFFLYKTESTILNKPKLLKFLAPALALCWILHLSYSIWNSTELIYCTSGQIIKSIILFIGYTVVIHRFGCIFYEVCVLSKNKKATAFFDRHGFIKIVLILFVLWLPNFVLSYPANMFGDTWNQISMAFGYENHPRTTHHPATMTMLLYAFIQFGTNTLKNPNIGLFLYELCQWIFALLVFSYTIKVMVTEFDSPITLVVATFTVFALSPYFSNSVTIIEKDIPYSVAYVLLSTELALFVKEPQKLKQMKHIAISSIAVIVVFLFRNNGPYALTLIFLVYAIFLLKKHMIKYIAVFVAPMIISAVILSCVVNLGGFLSGSKVEMLCLPMQQTGRIISFFPEDITDEQRAVLENVSDFERLSQAYYPYIADPVKESFYKWKTTDEYLDFLKVWLQLATEHPTTALSATIAQNLPLVCPLDINAGIYSGPTSFDSAEAPDYGPIADDLGIKEFSAFTVMRNNITLWYFLMTRLPIISLFSQQAIYVIILLFLTCFSICNKNRKFLLATLPAYVGILMVIVGPSIQFFPRYAYPVIFQIPMLTAFYIYTNSTQ